MPRLENLYKILEESLPKRNTLSYCGYMGNFYIDVKNSTNNVIMVRKGSSILSNSTRDIEFDLIDESKYYIILCKSSLLLYNIGVILFPLDELGIIDLVGCIERNGHIPKEGELIEKLVEVRSQVSGYYPGISVELWKLGDSLDLNVIFREDEIIVCNFYIVDQKYIKKGKGQLYKVIAKVSRNTLDITFDMWTRDRLLVGGIKDIDSLIQNLKIYNEFLSKTFIRNMV